MVGPDARSIDARSLVIQPQSAQIALCRGGERARRLKNLPPDGDLSAPPPREPPRAQRRQQRPLNLHGAAAAPPGSGRSLVVVPLPPPVRQRTGTHPPSGAAAHPHRSHGATQRAAVHSCDAVAVHSTAARSGAAWQRHRPARAGTRARGLRAASCGGAAASTHQRHAGWSCCWGEADSVHSKLGANRDVQKRGDLRPRWVLGWLGAAGAAHARRGRLEEERCCPQRCLPACAACTACAASCAARRPSLAVSCSPACARAADFSGHDVAVVRQAAAVLGLVEEVDWEFRVSTTCCCSPPLLPPPLPPPLLLLFRSFAAAAAAAPAGKCPSLTSASLGLAMHLPFPAVRLLFNHGQVSDQRQRTLLRRRSR